MLVTIGCGNGEFVDPCEGQTCSGNGACVAAGEAAYCACNPGFHPGGLGCLANDPDVVCRGVTCNSHGVCMDREGLPLCDCDPGYEPDRSGLMCFVAASGDGDADADSDGDVESGVVYDPGCSLSLAGPGSLVRYCCGDGEVHQLVASDEGGFAVVWIDNFRELTVLRVLDRVGMPVGFEWPLADVAVPEASVIWSEGEWLALMRRVADVGDEITLAHFQPDGEPLGAEVVLDQGDVSGPLVVRTATGLLAVWSRREADVARVQVQALEADGAPLGLAEELGACEGSCVATHLIWTPEEESAALVLDDRPSEEERSIRLVLLDESGASVGSPVEIGASPLDSNLVVPSVAWAAGRYAVVYSGTSQGQLEAQLVDGSGCLGEPHRIGHYRGSFVVPAGDAFALPILTSGREWVLYRIDAEGAHIEPDPVLPGDQVRAIAPQRVLWMESYWAIAYERNPTYVDIEVVFDRLACDPACDHDRDGAESQGCEGGRDCDDLDPSIRPGAPELCNLIDDDCDEVIDELCN
jgi:hypothetical protein